MDDLFAISTWQDQTNGMGKHSWNNIGNFEYGANTYHCSNINNTNEIIDHHTLCNHALRVSSMAPCLSGRDTIAKGSHMNLPDHQDLSIYSHGNIVHQYDGLLSAQANYIEKHQITSVASRPLTSGSPQEAMVTIEANYLGKELWRDEASWRRHRALDASGRGQGRLEMRVGQRSQPQINAMVATGNLKPRTRARRGQATDPHSIAERHRRERIADKMKKLHELVPNLNKADKAAMLDEIISYVRFLRLQMMVLNTNNLGSTGATAPLLPDGTSSDSIFHQCQAFPESPDLSAQSSVEAAMIVNTGVDHSSKIMKVEEEAVKLMEADMSLAMRFLQKKGLCLMPISLARIFCSKDSSSTCFTNPKES